MDDNASYGAPTPDDETIPAPFNGDARQTDGADEDLLDWFQEQYRQAQDHSHEWRIESRQAYDFYSGTQWSQEDAAILKEQLRPIITFNRVGPMVDIVVGLEAGNQQETQYIPRQVGQQAVNDLLTSAAKFFRDECDAGDEESDAFWDCVVTGMGWTESRLDFDEDADGKFKIDRLDPMEMYWDPSAKKRNLSDARYFCRVMDLPLSEARELAANGATDDELHAGWAEDTAANSKEPHDAQAAPFYRNDQSGQIDKERMRCRLVEFQWWQLDVHWRFVDPFTGELKTVSDADWDRLLDRLSRLGMQSPQAMRVRLRRYRRALVGAKVLRVWEGPAKGGFTWKCITAKRDRNKNLWYGIVKAMIDPQLWANKFFSQSLHILNTGAKGGIMAEEDAFEDFDDAQEEWADPAAIVKVSKGALSGGAIQERPQNPMPPALDRLLQLAISSIRDTTGINVELLGLVEKDQPGILEHMRKQAGMTVLASLFNSLRRYRKEQGRLTLYFITTFLSDGRLIRIGGPEEIQYVRLVHQPDVVEYDVIVDETPTSPNMKEQTWAILTQMMPFLTKLPVPPQVYLELLKYSPLPATVVAKVAAIIGQQQPPPNPALIKAQSSAALDQAKAMLFQAQAKTAGLEAQGEQTRLQAENAKTVLEAHRFAADNEERRANIESKRAAAIASLVKAGTTVHDAKTDRILAVVDLLDKLMPDQDDGPAPMAQGTQTVQ